MSNFNIKLLPVALMVFGFFFTTANAQLVISEYVEGSSYNKCFEIWNTSGASVNLGAYGYRAYHNGSSTPTYDFTFASVTLNDGDVYYMCHPSASSACDGAADATDNRILFNGDDAIAIYDTATGNNIDIFGSIGQDPGSRWTGSCGHRTKDRTLRRKPSVTAGVTAASTGFPTLCDNWEQFNNNTCDDLGTAPAGADPSCLIISEVVEGTGFCKFIEIYNPNCASVDLSGFQINIYFNSCAGTPYTIQLSGTLASKATQVLYNPNQTCFAGALPSNFVSDTRVQHNGNDAIELVNTGTGSTCDIFGNICENPSGGWTDAGCAGVSTQNQTLRRDVNVCTGVTTDPATGFPTLCTEWDTAGVDVVSDLGSHSDDCIVCDPTKKPAAEAAASEANVVAFPNPFQNETTIRFNLDIDTEATLAVFNLAGERVATLFNGNVEAGANYEVTFNGNNLPAGTYFYRMIAGEASFFGKVVLMK